MTTSAMNPLHERVNEALRRWLDFASDEAEPREDGVTGIIGGGMSFMHKDGRDFCSWEMAKGADLFNTAQEVDPTGLTTLMLLAAEMEFYADDEQFTIRQFVRDESVRERIDEYREFIAWLEEHEETRDAIEGFQSWLTKAIKPLVPEDREDVAELVADVLRLARVRYHAVTGIEHLSVYQFAQGGQPRNSCRFSKFVYEFRNVEKLVLSMHGQKEDGISLSLIRDEVTESSFFAFAIRCGHTVTVLTDHERDAHPMQKHIRRSRMAGRSLDKRATRFWFPYHLLNVTVDEKGDVRRTKPVGSSLGNQIADRVCMLDELHPEEVAWLAIMFDLIKKKFWDERHEVPTLAITGQQRGRPNPQLPNFTPDQVTAKTIESAVETRLHGKVFMNEWLEKRYKDGVPQEVYDVTSDRPLMLPDHRAKKEVTVFEAVKDQLKTLDATAFGLPEEMKADQLFMTRFNQAVAVNELADQEYEERHEEIEAWFEERVRANDQVFLKAAATGVFKGRSWTYNHKTHRRDWSDEGNLISEQVRYTRWKQYGSGYGRSVRLFHQEYRGKSRWHRKYPDTDLCYVTRRLANVWTVFSAQDAVGIAQLACCEVEDLPDVIRQWTTNSDSDGNHLLNAIDPMRWKVDDPWNRRACFDVTLGLSKSHWNAMLKEHGLELRELQVGDPK